MECEKCRNPIPAGAACCPSCGSPCSGETPRFAALNRVFSGRYDFQCLLGIGGFAEVYLARDVLLEREVAVKILLPQHAREAETVERFLREARLYAKLEHGNIIPIFDTGVLQQHVFITMKYIRGESLKTLLSRQGRLPPRQLPAIARGVAAALGYIHQQGIVHRDIKPANILVEKGSQAVYLADFGIARAESSQTLTQTGMIVGTPHYLSPEQIKGKRIDARSDIYSLGATLYELATGRPPFQGDSPMEILYQHVNENAQSLDRLAPDIDPRMERIIARCIEKDPQRRFQKAEEIIAALESPGTPPGPDMGRTVLTSAVTRGRGHGGRWLAGATLLAALAAGAYFLWLRPRPAVVPGAAEPKPPPPAASAKREPAHLPETREPGASEQGKKAQEPAPRQVAAAAALPGAVRFSSFPPLADIYFQGARIGNTEQVFARDFPPGAHVFTFTIPGFQSAEVRVEVRSGETAGAHYRFPPFRSFTVTSLPFGRVQIDGKDYGDTPQTVKLAFGGHTVRVTKEGYLPAERTVTVDPTARNSVHFELTKEEMK